MSYITQTKNLRQALKKDHILPNPEVWKKRQLYMIGLIPVIANLKVVFPQHAAILDETFLTRACEIFFTLASMYLVPATSGKVGL